MKRPRTLTAAFVRNVRDPGRYGDGRGSAGLSLLVKPTRIEGRLSKTWAQQVTINGRPTSIGLGSYPTVGLALARRKAIANARLLAEGLDPRKGRSAPTFRKTAEVVIAARIPTWRDGGKSAKQWRASLERYAYPLIGDKSVAEITSRDILALLSPHWSTRPETMRRVKQRIGAILAHAVADGHRDDNPARGPVISSALPRQSGRTPQRALPHSKVAGALAKVESSRAHRGTILATRFLVLTATRSGETRGAMWSECDLDAATWTVSGERTKTGKPFRVPLSSAAMRVLVEARELPNAGTGGLVFPSPRGLVLSDSTISKLFRELGIGCVPHGMRSSFRDWCGESGVPREVAEQALAHVVPGIEGAYARSDLLEVRRPVMQAWADYLAQSFS